MLRRLVSLFRSRRIEHEYFGRIRYFEYAKTGARFWEGSLTLPGDRSTLDITIDAEKEGPTAQHVAFAKAILDHPDGLWEKCESLFQECFDAAGHQLSPTPSDFRLSGFSIPAGGNATDRWEASFDMELDPSRHVLTVYFDNGVVTGHSIDG